VDANVYAQPFAAAANLACLHFSAWRRAFQTVGGALDVSIRIINGVGISLRGEGRLTA